MNWSINNSTTAHETNHSVSFAKLLFSFTLKIQKDLRAAQRRRKTESEYCSTTIAVGGRISTNTYRWVREKVKGECKMQFRHTHPLNHFTSVNTTVTLLLWTSYVYPENYKVREVRVLQRITTEITKNKNKINKITHLPNRWFWLSALWGLKGFDTNPNLCYPCVQKAKCAATLGESFN